MQRRVVHAVVSVLEGYYNDDTKCRSYIGGNEYSPNTSFAIFGHVFGTVRRGFGMSAHTSGIAKQNAELLNTRAAYRPSGQFDQRS